MDLVELRDLQRPLVELGRGSKLRDDFRQRVEDLGRRPDQVFQPEFEPIHSQRRGQVIHDGLNDGDTLQKEDINVKSHIWKNTAQWLRLFFSSGCVQVRISKLPTFSSGYLCAIIMRGFAVSGWHSNPQSLGSFPLIGSLDIALSALLLVRLSLSKQMLNFYHTKTSQGRGNVSVMRQTWATTTVI